jgi:hypothetical protein
MGLIHMVKRKSCNINVAPFVQLDQNLQKTVRVNSPLKLGRMKIQFKKAEQNKLFYYQHSNKRVQ